MTSTIFPTRPAEVAVLTASEFALDLEWKVPPSLDEVCRRFDNDANRAFVWFIRFRALQTWWAREDSAQWTTAARAAYVWETAASFELNSEWEFDAAPFCLAVDALCNRRVP